MKTAEIEVVLSSTKGEENRIVRIIFFVCKSKIAENRNRRNRGMPVLHTVQAANGGLHAYASLDYVYLLSSIDQDLRYKMVCGSKAFLE